MLDPLREILCLDPDTPDETVVEQAVAVIRSMSGLATVQAGELARKDAAFDRIGAAAKDGLRPFNYPPTPRVQA